MSKRTPTPWAIKKADKATASGIRTVNDIFGADGTRVLVNLTAEDRALIVESVNALAGRDPAALGELEKAVESAIAMDIAGQIVQTDDLADALAAFRAKKEETAR